MLQYRLADLLGEVPKDQYFNRLDEFCVELDISRSHAYRYMRAKWDEPVNIPIIKLIKAADFFKITVDQLINHPTSVPV